MSHPAFLEIAVEGEEDRFLRYDPRNKAHQDEARRQAGHSLSVWLQQWEHLVTASDAREVAALVDRLRRRR